MLSIAAIQSLRVNSLTDNDAARFTTLANRISFLSVAFLGDLKDRVSAGTIEDSNFRSLESMAKSSPERFGFMVFGHFIDSLGCNGMESIERSFPRTAIQFNRATILTSLSAMVNDRKFLLTNPGGGLSLLEGESFSEQGTVADTRTESIGNSTIHSLLPAGLSEAAEIGNLTIAPAVFGGTQDFSHVFNDPTTWVPELMDPAGKAGIWNSAIASGDLSPNFPSPAQRWDYSEPASASFRSLANERNLYLEAQSIGVGAGYASGSREGSRSSRAMAKGTAPIRAANTTLQGDATIFGTGAYWPQTRKR